MRAALRNWPLPRGRWFFLKICQQLLKNRDFLMEIEPGVFMPAELDDFMHFWCFMGEYPKRDPRLALSHALLRPNHVVFDVGANLGMWVMGAATKTGAGAQYHAFEPVPEIYDRLIHNLRLNHLDQQIRCAKIGLSDKPGQATFYRASRPNSGMGSLGRREGVDLPLDIELTTVDQYCKEQGIGHVDFMKVDVEGAELLVYRGAKKLLSAEDAPAILYECSEDLVAPFNCTATMVKAQLHEYGYQVYRYDGQRLSPISVGEKHPKIEDVFAFKPRHFEIHPELAGKR